MKAAEQKTLADFARETIRRDRQTRDFQIGILSLVPPDSRELVFVALNKKPAFTKRDFKWAAAAEAVERRRGTKSDIDLIAEEANARNLSESELQRVVIDKTRQTVNEVRELLLTKFSGSAPRDDQ